MNEMFLELIHWIALEWRNHSVADEVPETIALEWRNHSVAYEVPETTELPTTET